MAPANPNSIIAAIPASALSAADMSSLFTRGFQQYFAQIHVDEELFERMVDINDLDLDGSRVVTEDGVPMAFAMLGIRSSRGWIGGMGVPPEARGRGLGRVAMDAVLEQARERGLREVDLEVLVQNEPAIRIYQELEFVRLRDLAVWSRPAGPAPEERDPRVASVPVSDCIELEDHGSPDRLPWQRGLRVIHRCAPESSAFGVREGDAVSAWVLFRADESQVRILDVFLADEADPALLSASLAGMLRAHPGIGALLMNQPEGRWDESLRRAGFTVQWRQHEMRLTL